MEQCIWKHAQKDIKNNTKYYPMKRLFVTLICCCCLVSTTLAMKPLVNYAVFNSPTDGPYVETYFMIPGSEVDFVRKDNGQMQAAVEVTLLFKQAEEIKTFDKYVLMSEEVASPQEKMQLTLVDLKRMSLPNGTYDLEVVFKDMNNTENTATYVDQVIVNVPSNQIVVSDIVLLEDYEETKEETVYSKSGFDLLPDVLHYFPRGRDRLAFYAEIYQTDAVLGTEEAYLSTFSVRKKGDERYIKKLHQFKKQKAAPVNVILGEFNIEALPSGNFEVVIEVRNKKNEVLVRQSTPFFCNRPKEELDIEAIKKLDVTETFVADLTGEKLVNHVGSLHPIASKRAKQYIQNLKVSRNETMMRQFVYNFWMERNSADPEQDFEDYQTVVASVDNMYGSKINEGYETDRGRVYLQYGPPNDLRNSNSEPGAYPYEIWQYYDIPGNQGLMTFVFYNPNFADNDFELIHSDVRGELQNPRWRFLVHNSTQLQNNGLDIDGQNVKKGYGSRIDDF